MVQHSQNHQSPSVKSSQEYREGKSVKLLAGLKASEYWDFMINAATLQEGIAKNSAI